MITKEERILCAIVALHEAGQEPMDLVSRLFSAGQDHRVITYVTLSGVLVQMMACRFDATYFLVAKCAQEDDRCWTVVWQ
jgi:hypothetical protein